MNTFEDAYLKHWLAGWLYMVWAFPLRLPHAAPCLELRYIPNHVDYAERVIASQALIYVGNGSMLTTQNVLIASQASICVGNRGA